MDPAHYAEKAWFYEELKMTVDAVGEEKALAASMVLARAQDLERRGRHYEAWRAYNDLARMVPQSKIAKGALNGYISRRMLVRAEGLEKKNRYFEAAHTYRDALLRNKNDGKAWYGLGKIYFKYQKHAQAATCFEKVVSLKPQGNEDLADWLKVYKIQSKLK